VIPNAIPEVPVLPPREELRERLRANGTTFAFAGRLTPAKALDVALDAVGRVEGVTLLVAGDGEERARLEARAPANVRFVGPLDRRGVLELLAAVDATVLSSAWENFPHVLVESLAVGTPILATAVGGVPEIVDDGVSGLLVPAGDPAALGDAIARLRDDDELRRRLRAGAAASAGRFAPSRVLSLLEDVLERAAR
jgi:glycosyltransferase involved in cell wall biosynthesis